MTTIANRIQERNNKVLDILRNVGNASLRIIAQLAGLSKDAVNRALKSLERRNVYPESSLWETEIGQIWLCRLLIAVMLEFGIKGGVGAEIISAFFRLIHLEKNLAISPNVLRILARKLENLVIEYGKLQEESQAGTEREIVAAGDETFFKDRILLIAMDLGSGYLLMEEDAQDRTFETWSEKLKNRLEQMGCKVRHFISDRAKALIKLAVEGLHCNSGADLFHAQQEITRWLGMGFRTKLASIKKEIQRLQDQLQAQGVSALEIVQQLLAVAKEKQKRFEEGKEKYGSLLRGISKILHPFTMTGVQKTTSGVVEEMQEQAQALSMLGEEYDISDPQGRLGKFTRQIKNLANTIDAWWLWVEESIKNLDPSLKPGMEKYRWAIEILLPKVYWEMQVTRTDTVELRDVYRITAQNAVTVWQSHPLTKSLSEVEIQRFHLWAEWMCRQFQRSSSAVEGRNGCLSQRYHNGRGLSARSLKALTVIHNFDTHQSDGTTPAERLFGTQFPNLFEWILGEIDQLPSPRSSKSLNLQVVAA